MEFPCFTLRRQGGVIGWLGGDVLSVPVPQQDRPMGGGGWYQRTVIGGPGDNRYIQKRLRKDAGRYFWEKERRQLSEEDTSRCI